MKEKKLERICAEIGPGFDLAEELPDRVVIAAYPDEMASILRAAIAAGPEVAAELKIYLNTAAQDLDVWKSARIGEVWEENK